MNVVVDLAVVIFIQYEDMRSEVFLNKCFEGREERGGIICLLKTKKWDVGKCRCFCDMVWLSHIGDFCRIFVVIVPVVRYVLINLIIQ